MTYWIYSDLRDLVRKDLGLEGERFVKSWEMMMFTNDGITLVESKIHNLYEDYFLTDYQPTVSAGDSQIMLPEDIFASRIRWIQYDDGSDDYKVKKLKLKDLPRIEQGDDYRYLIVNGRENGVRVRIFPASRIDTSTAFTIWYIRNANRVTGSNSIIDIPEFGNVIELYLKWRCCVKAGFPQIEAVKEELDTAVKTMTDSLTNQTDDEENEIEPDFKIYQDMS